MPHQDSDSRLDVVELSRIQRSLQGLSDPVAMLESIFAFAPFGLQVYRADGQSLLVNRAYREMYGSEPPPEYNVFEDETLARNGVLPLVKRAFSGERVHLPAMWYPPSEPEPNSAPPFRRVAIETWIVPLFDAERRVTHVALIAKNVTAETMAREALEREAQARRAAERARAKLARLQQVTSALARAASPAEVARVILEQGLTALGVTRGVVYVRAEEGDALELLGSVGLAPEHERAVKLMPLSLPTPSGDALTTGEAQWIPSAEEGRARFPELWQRIEDWHVAQLAAIPLATGGRPFAVLAFDWVTEQPLDEDDWAFAFALARQGAQALERARFYREAEEAARRAEEASRAKDEFLSVISHELRTPLNAMQGWAHLMLKNRQKDESIIERGLQVIVRNAKAQATIIDDILDMARVITGKLRLSLHPTDLATVLDAAVESVRPSASAKNITLDIQVERNVTALADPDRIHQVLWNLLSNAIKFTDEGGLVVVRLERRKSSVHIEVEDNGPGIAEKDLPYLFDRFRQVDSSKTRAKGGLGLGLALVRQLVQAHGGQVSVESAGLGKGARFSVELPTHAAVLSAAKNSKSSAAPSTVAAMATDTAPDLEQLEVLVVDDEPDAAELVRILLEERGAHVRVAHSAAEGFELARGRRPDVLVSDIAMPGEDGYSLLRRLRAASAEFVRMPAIALTAHARPEDADEAKNAGYLFHIAKPAEASTIVRLVARAAASRAALP